MTPAKLLNVIRPTFKNEIIVVVAILAGTVGCGSNSSVTSTDSLPSPVTTTAPNSIEIAYVYEDFEYYGACGNETVPVGEQTFFPLLPDDRSEIDPALYPLPPSDSGISGFAAAPRVVSPGPGDDIGTMVVYSDGIARFESESGRIIWLTDQEQTYGWVC